VSEGACPKSYGTNVARLAGLPPKVVTRAAEVSAQWDHRQPADSDSMEVDAAAARGEEGNGPTDLKALMSEIQAWRSRGEEVDLVRLRQLQATAAQLASGAGKP
jgi:DNA mismatch repair ATPase MutS